MHSALRIPEIFLCILDHATTRQDDENLGDKPEKDNLKIQEKTALNLALTCKSFHSFALDRLWSTLFSMIPLLKTLPTTIWSLSRVKHWDGGKRHHFVSHRTPT